jgi:predicted NBD/HSP70 family sugar kinase
MSKSKAVGPVGVDAIGRVLGRVMIASPEATPQVDIATGAMLAHPKALSLATVGRAVGALAEAGFVCREDPKPDRPGRPVVPIRLGSENWVLVGVHLDYEEDIVRGITAVVTTLDGECLADRTQRFTGRSPKMLNDVVAPTVATLKRLTENLPESMEILGVGIEVGAQVRSDQVVAEVRHGSTNLGEQISKALDGTPVVVENDVNALAIRSMYVSEFPDFALVAVFHGGIGGALVTGGHLLRGANGVAGEIGHVRVEYDNDTPGPACRCGQHGHVDALATPARMAQSLDIGDIAEAAPDALFESESLSPSARVFHRGGVALGRGLADLVTLTNPGRLLLLLPAELGAPKPGTAAVAYVQAAEAEVACAFSVLPEGALGSELKLEVGLWDSQTLPIEGATAGAFCVLHALIEHARGRDECKRESSSL